MEFNEKNLETIDQTQKWNKTELAKSLIGIVQSDMTDEEIREERLTLKHGTPKEQIQYFIEKATDKELEQLAEFIKETFWR